MFFLVQCSAIVCVFLLLFRCFNIYLLIVIIIIGQGRPVVNQSTLTGCYLVGILPYRLFPGNSH